MPRLSVGLRFNGVVTWHVAVLFIAFTFLVERYSLMVDALGHCPFHASSSSAGKPLFDVMGFSGRITETIITSRSPTTNTTRVEDFYFSVNVFNVTSVVPQFATGALPCRPSGYVNRYSVPANSSVNSECLVGADAVALNATATADGCRYTYSNYALNYMYVIELECDPATSKGLILDGNATSYAWDRDPGAVTKLRGRSAYVCPRIEPTTSGTPTKTTHSPGTSTTEPTMTTETTAVTSTSPPTTSTAAPPTTTIAPTATKFFTSLWEEALVDGIRRAIGEDDEDDDDSAASANQARGPSPSPSPPRRLYRSKIVASCEGIDDGCNHTCFVSFSNATDARLAVEAANRGEIAGVHSAEIDGGETTTVSPKDEDEDKGDPDKRRAIIIGAGVAGGVVLLVAVALLVFIVLRRRRRSGRYESSLLGGTDSRSVNSRYY